KSDRQTQRQARQDIAHKRKMNEQLGHYDPAAIKDRAEEAKPFAPAGGRRFPHQRRNQHGPKRRPVRKAAADDRAEKILSVIRPRPIDQDPQHFHKRDDDERLDEIAERKLAANRPPAPNEDEEK